MLVSLKSKNNLKERADLLRAFLTGVITSEEFDEKQKIYQRDLKSNSSIEKVKRRDKKTYSTKNKREFVESSKLSDEELFSLGRCVSNPKTDYHARDGYKICRCCNLSYSVDYFHRNAGTADGYDGTCKTCKVKRREFSKKENLKLRTKDLENNVSKVCKHCNSLKPISEFAERLSSFRGSSHTCKSCK